MKISPFYRNRLWALSGISISLIGPYFLLEQNPQLDTSQSYCPIKLVTGFPCPGCGMTKSLAHWAHGHWAEALYWHPLSLLFIGFFLFIAGWLLWELWNKKNIPWPWAGKPWIGYSLGAILGGFHLLRLALIFGKGEALTYWQSGLLDKLSTWLLG